MQSREIMVAKQILFLLTTAILTLSGCDKVKSVVDDVKSSTTAAVNSSAPDAGHSQHSSGRSCGTN